jgi:hypothetical protein
MASLAEDSSSNDAPSPQPRRSLAPVAAAARGATTASARTDKAESIADFIRAEVLALTYTAHDMAPFARDVGYVDATGEVLPPFVWDAEDRAHRMARLDAIFMRFTASVRTTRITYCPPSRSSKSRTNRVSPLPNPRPDPGLSAASHGRSVDAQKFRRLDDQLFAERHSI